MQARWTRVDELDIIPPGGLTTFKHGAHQLVVGRRLDGSVFALDNRCPHEGYPLAQGELKDGTLTCCWHNWKFDVASGRCRLGGEDVRVYPVRVAGGTVEVDLADPDPEVVIPSLKESLERGLFEHDVARVLRDGVRLLQAGYDPWHLLADAALDDARRAEYGTTHALPVAADCGRLLERHRGPEAMYAIAPALDMAGDANRRLLPRPRAEPRPGATLERVRAALEDEDVGAAEGLVRGAFDGGASWRTVERWLYASFADHFTGFGHQLIYLVKAGELLSHVDDGYAPDILAALAVSYGYATREDTLPYMRVYKERLDAVAGELSALHQRADPSATGDPARLLEAVLDGTAAEACEALHRDLSRGVPAPRLARTLVVAAAHRLLRFDVDHDQDPDVAETWLWATHRLTFAAAVRHAVTRFDDPASLRFLYQAVAFINSGRGMDLPPERRHRPAPRDGDLGELLAAIAQKRTADALALTAGWLAGKRRLDELRHRLEDLALRDVVVRPIVVAHVLKTTIAAFEEHDALGDDPDRGVPLLALVAFLASPVRERRVRDAVTTSIRWVVEDRMPKKLTQ